jgi:DNA invertase Pin-like site-specific DNA recombinase
MTGNGQRLLLAARKSRKGDEASQFERQEARNRERAERDGHVIIHTTRDVVSSQTMPWERKELKSWMTDPVKLAMYDGILVETDRLARCDDKGWHYIEGWCYDNDKKIFTAEGVQFPPRDDSDRYQWIGLKRRARTYWEDVRDKHAGTRELIRANGGAIGKAPFGYVVSGVKLRKTFTIDPVWGPVAREAFQRISEGHTATSVAIWLTEATGNMWRVKRVTEMIQRRTYLGERDGHEFEPLVDQAVWDQANAALATRSFKQKDQGGRRAVHGYSGLIYCECGAKLYRHKTDTGHEKYRCGRGRSGDVRESRCEFTAPNFAEINEKIDAFMLTMKTPDVVVVTTGGDHGKQMELQRLTDEMKAATARVDMAEVMRLAPLISALQNTESEPIKLEVRETGKTYADEWDAGNLADRRSLLGRLAHKVTVKMVEGEWRVVLVNL